MEVEVGKEGEEQDSITEGPRDQPFRDAGARDEDQLGHVEEDENELGELELSEVPLPPEEGADAGAHRSQQVVRVHDGVDEGVEERQKRDLTPWGVGAGEPRADEHAAVVDDVELRHLGELPPGDEEGRVG